MNNAREKAETSPKWNDLALAVYATRLVRGRRVCAIASEKSDLVAHLRTNAAKVDSTLRAPNGKYDVVVVPDVLLKSFVEAGGLRLVCDAVVDGGVVIAATYANGALSYEDFYAKMADMFPHVRMAGQAGFAGYSIADFGASANPAIVFDGSLLGDDTEEPSRYFAVGSADEIAIDAYAIVQVPAESQVRTVETVVERIVEKQVAVVEPELNAEFIALETQLHEQGASLRAAQAEVDRRGTLARDLMEELAQLRNGESLAEPSTSPESHERELTGRVAQLEKEKRAAAARVLESEAKKVEALFRVDELLGQLTAEKVTSQQKLDAWKAREAELVESVRALQARASEVEELHSAAQARLALTEQDLNLSRDQMRVMERELVEARDQVEYEIARTHSDPSALK